MTYLLDVNSLLALGVLQHEFHQRVAAWVARLAKKGIPDLATSSITELGFVRVLSQAQQYRFSVLQARELLLLLKASESIRCSIIPDGHDIAHLPKWVKSPKQTTDGHLVELARSNGAQLATLDGKIPGSFLIPQNR
jgi:predicted nucleic acid-binding protein